MEGWDKSTGVNLPNEKEIMMKIKTLWFHEFECPVRGEWYNDGDGIISVMKDRLNGNPQTIISVVMTLAEAKSNNTKCAAGYGQKFNLGADNNGILFVALSLNMGLLLSMATCIHNSTNRDSNPGMVNVDFKWTFQKFRNMLLNTLGEYADVKILAVPNTNTGGDKGDSSPWSIGQYAFQELLKETMELGKQ